MQTALLIPPQFVTLSLACALVHAAPAVVPLTPMAGVAAYQSLTGSGNTRLYYQDSTGQIIKYAMVGPFSTGHTLNGGFDPLVPADEVLPCTPIAATIIGDGTNGVSALCI